MDRYELIFRIEKNSLDKDIPIWYIKDIGKGKYGKLVAKIFDETLALLALEYWNGKKKLPRTRKSKKFLAR